MTLRPITLPVRPFFVLFVFIVSLLPELHAHDPDFNTAQAEIQPGSLRAKIILSTKDADSLVSLSSGNIKDETEAYRLLAAKVLKVRFEGSVIVATKSEVSADEEDVTFDLVFSLPENGSLELSSPILRDLSFGHRQHFILTSPDGETITEQLWNHSTQPFQIEVVADSDQSAEQARTSLWPFLFMGMEHIFIGFDHILFLFALLLVCRDLRSAAIVITAFTVAHSITLALATLDLARLPDRVVEPAIALSIIYVGIENLWRKGEPSNRWPLVFAFGLVHGLGFAGELRTTGIGDGSLTSVIAPLLSFNIGIEVGQVMIAAIALPIIWYFRRRPTFIRTGVAWCSAGIVLFGIFWFLERTIFG